MLFLILLFQLLIYRSTRDIRLLFAALNGLYWVGGCPESV